MCQCNQENCEKQENKVKTQAQKDRENDSKICRICQLSKKLDEFYYSLVNDYYYPYCKSCKNSKKRVGKKEKQIERDTILGIKTCSTCSETKTLDNFYFSRGVYHPSCKECRSKDWKSTHPKKPKKVKQIEIDIKNGFKICSGCKKQKDLSKFTFKKKRNGYEGKCGACNLIIAKKWRKKNIEKVREKNRIRSKINYRKNIIENRKKSCERAKKSYQKHREKIREKCRSKEYREKVRIRRNTPKEKLNMSMGGGIRKSLGKNKRGLHWESLVDYNIDDLKIHLESQFMDGMNWENMGNKSGKWVIDHILPVELFEYENEIDKQFQYCWSLKNLRPLWNDENASKQDKLPNGRVAKFMSIKEKQEYLISIGLGYLLDNFESVQDNATHLT